MKVTWASLASRRHQRMDRCTISGNIHPDRILVKRVLVGVEAFERVFITRLVTIHRGIMLVSEDYSYAGDTFSGGLSALTTQRFLLVALQLALTASKTGLRVRRRFVEQQRLALPSGSRAHVQYSRGCGSAGVIQEDADLRRDMWECKASAKVGEWCFVMDTGMVEGDKTFITGKVDAGCSMVRATSLAGPVEARALFYARACDNTESQWPCTVCMIWGLGWRKGPCACVVPGQGGTGSVVVERRRVFGRPSHGRRAYAHHLQVGMQQYMRTLA